MLAIKPAAALLVLGLGGLLGINEAPALRVAGSSVAHESPATVAQPTPPGTLALRAAVQDAAQAKMRTDLDDASATLAIARFVVARPSVRSIEARGQGELRMEGSTPVPVDVVAVYDVIDGRLESVDYTAHAATAAPTVADVAIRAALERKIGAKLAGEFAGQAVQFQLLDVWRIGYGRHRTQLQGTGKTDFGAEGVAYTPFVATLDKHTGELLDLKYDLLQEDDTAGDATVASR